MGRGEEWGGGRSGEGNFKGLDPIAARKSEKSPAIRKKRVVKSCPQFWQSVVVSWCWESAGVLGSGEIVEMCEIAEVHPLANRIDLSWSANSAPQHHTNRFNLLRGCDLFVFENTSGPPYFFPVANYENIAPSSARDPIAPAPHSARATHFFFRPFAQKSASTGL